jgi:hypothetical protein
MARPDPRAEEEGSGAHSIERVAMSDVTADKRAAEPAPSSEDRGVALPAEATPKEREPARPAVTSDDPRMLEIEPLLETNDWKGAAAKLGPLEDAGKLPPNLGLIAAIAHNEAVPDGSPEARALAVRCAAALLGMPTESEVARILARRLLRKPVVRMHERPAPPARTSALIVVIVLALGGALGWFLSSPYATHLLSMLRR